MLERIVTLTFDTAELEAKLASLPKHVLSQLIDNKERMRLDVAITNDAPANATGGPDELTATIRIANLDELFIVSTGLAGELLDAHS
jgi:hypothetical protein